jgi:Predicted metal-dependent hydrolase with the TIM-barrel fold
VLSLAVRLEPSKITNDLKDYYEQTAALGITTVQNMCTQHYAQQVVNIYSTREFPCRVRLMAWPFTDSKELLLHAWDNYFHPLNKMNYVSGVKIVLDGTPLERLACIRTPYKDKPDEYGRLNFDEAQLKQYMQYSLAHKQQIIIHAVGDSSIVTIIRCMRSLHPDSFWKDKRLRIEHGEFAIEKPGDINTLNYWAL